MTSDEFRVVITINWSFAFSIFNQCSLCEIWAGPALTILYYLPVLALEFQALRTSRIEGLWKFAR